MTFDRNDKNSPLINLTHITKRFAGVTALNEVSLTIQPGAIRCLAGENGSGKSTLIKIIAGAYQPDSGQIQIHGQTVKSWQPLDAIRAGIQVIYQDFSLFPNLIVAENIALNSHIEKNRFLMSWRQTQQIAEHALAYLGIQIDSSSIVSDLSISQKQLIAIAKALIQDTKLIIMDEPTTALTQKEINTLFQIINKLQSQGISILFVSHKLQEILEIGEKITVLRDGEVVVDGPSGDFDYKKLVFHMTGQQLLDTRYTHTDKHDRQYALRVENLSKNNAFQDINFTIKQGEIIGITGLLGSGRSALAKALFGLVSPDSGQILVNEQPVKLTNPQTAIQHGIAYVPEDRLTEGLFLEQSIERNMAVSNLSSWTNKWGWILSRMIRQNVTHWLAELNIKVPSISSPINILSGGNQQKVVLAKWLLTRIHILILNGPTVGIDIGAKAEIHQKLKELAKHNKAIIIFSDDFSEIIQTCNRIFIMHKGSLIEELDPQLCDENDVADHMSRLY